MLKVITFIIFMNISYAFSQEEFINNLCENTKYENSIRSSLDPIKTKDLLDSFNDKIKPRSYNHYIIPVVFHFMTDLSIDQGLAFKRQFSASRLQSTIFQLNEYFKVANISFCLAFQYENNNGKLIRLESRGLKDDSILFTKYLTKKQSQGNLKVINTPSEFDEELKKDTIIDPEHILNIWILDSAFAGNSFPFGFAKFPQFKPEDALPGLSKEDISLIINEQFLANKDNDGIVLQSMIFGSNKSEIIDQVNFYRKEIGLNPFIDNFNLLDDFSKSGVLAHEIGHYLSLFHTFGSNGCEDGIYGDFISDTPLQQEASGPICELIDAGTDDEVVNIIGNAPIICPKNDEFNFTSPTLDQLIIASNFMSLAKDNCKGSKHIHSFTKEQIIRMRHTLEKAEGRSLGRDKDGNNPYCESLTNDQLVNDLKISKIYPSPALSNSTLSIDYSLHNEMNTFFSIAELTIYNSLGQFMSQELISSNFPLEGKVTIDLPYLPSGQYILKLRFLNRPKVSIIKKIIITN